MAGPRGVSSLDDRRGGCVRRSERRRAGRWVRQQLRSELAQGWRRNWRMLLVFHSGYVLVVATLAVLFEVADSAPRPSAFALGILVGALPVFWVLFRDALGLAHRSMGAEAERWTASELAKLSPKWTVLHDISLDNVNVDHAVIGPGRLYAVETKWVGETPGHRRLQRLAGQAAYRAHKLKTVLRRAGGDVSPLPMLVLWGPGSNVLPSGGQHFKPSNVTAVAGRDASAWLPRIEEAGGGNPLDEVAEVLRTIGDR